MKAKKILVTGGTGFVGANLVRKLVSLGHKPTVLIRKGSNLWRLHDVLSKVKLVQTDMSDYKRLKSDLKKIQPNVIYHLATYGANQSIQNSGTDLVKTNILASYNFLEICCENGFEYFVNTGSSSEYGLKNSPMTEQDVLQPVNLYGASKGAVTLIARTLAQKYNLPIVTLRLFSPYGYFEEKNRFMSTLMTHAVKHRSINLSNPNYVRDFIFIDDLTDAYVHFLSSKEYFGEIFNIGSGKQYKIGDVVNLIQDISGKKLKINWSKHASNQLEPKIWVANITKANSRLRWSPKVPVKAGLKKTYEWFEKNIKLYS